MQAWREAVAAAWVKPDEPAANFQRRDNARPMDGAELRILAQLDAKQKGRQTKRRLNIRQQWRHNK
jgi:hypothetical protein